MNKSMKILSSVLIFCQACLFASTDYDCVVVGTSPFSMLEALYQHHNGQRVLMIDEADTYGGAWRSINICGIPNADMGCHEIGTQKEIKNFLECYVGCSLLSLDDPRMMYMEPPPPGSKGFYPASGCHELVDNLRKLVEKASIDVQLGCRLEKVYLNEEKNYAEVTTQQGVLSASKLIITPSTHLYLENYPDAPLNKAPCMTKHYHMYLLIEDSEPPRFTYEDDIIEGVSRGANLSWYLGLENSGMQLIVIQTYEECDLVKCEDYLEELKKLNFLGPHARILNTENYIYEQCYSKTDCIKQLSPFATMVFEVMDTWNFGRLKNYIGKWKQLLKPFEEALSGE